MNRIENFLKRIELDAEVELNLDFLGKVQSHAVTAIAYENLDILEGKAIKLDADSLYNKIVTRGRGGYCFELNGLLAAMLREMGFNVSERFSRYLRGENDVPMRRHRVVAVTMDDGDYMVDIGVGQIAPRFPLKIEEGLVQEQNGETYKFMKDENHGWVLWDLHKGQWREYIAFNDDKTYDVDFEQPSFYCEKHPDSVFNKEPMIAIKTEKGRKTIDGRVYKEFVVEELVHIEENISDERMAELLEKDFKLTPNK